MTAVTTSASPAKGRRGVVQGGSPGAEIGHNAAGLETAGGAVPGPRPPAATQPCQGGSGHAGEPPAERSATPLAGAPAPTSRTAATRLSQQVSPAETAAGRDAADQSAPASATVVEGVAEAFAVAYVDGLDGAERKILLHHIAQAFPDVVEAGAGLVEEWRADCAEHGRKRLRRNDHDRRRRRRAEAGDGG